MRLLVKIRTLHAMGITARRSSRTIHSSVYLTPRQQTVGAGNQFSLALRIRPIIETDAIQATITYNPAVLSFVGFSTTGSAFEQELSQTASSGLLQIERGTFSPVHNDSLVVTLTFTVTTATATTLTLSNTNATSQGSWTNPSTSNATVN